VPETAHPFLPPSEPLSGVAAAGSLTPPPPLPFDGTWGPLLPPLLVFGCEPLLEPLLLELDPPELEECPESVRAASLLVPASLAGGVVPPLDPPLDPLLEPPLATLQTPALVVPLVQVWPLGQPLPPASRQPALHACDAVSQMRPDVALPQSLSAAQPHTFVERHAAPLSVALHADLFAVVHSTHLFERVSHTLPLQSESETH
jgi:hypothetical protein